MPATDPPTNSVVREAQVRVQIPYTTLYRESVLLVRVWVKRDF